MSEAIKPTDRDGETRALIIKSDRSRFGLWNWAAIQNKTSVGDFARGALDQGARAAATKMIMRGVDAPQWVAEELRKIEENGKGMK